MSDNILEIKNLEVSFDTYVGEVQAVRDVSLNVKRGKVMAIVGESGCGKSVTARSIIKMVAVPGYYKGGSINFDGTDLIKVSEKEMRKIRGRDIGLILQDPITSLNPTMKVGDQIAESIKKHSSVKRAQVRGRVIEMLERVGIPNPERRMEQYPHEFSGGMRQRVIIAIALACNPKLLIADEPTTALDVTIQAQILTVIKKLQAEFNTSIILITHDLGVVAEMADEVTVMYAGKIIESGTAQEIFYDAKHPYTWGLLGSVPRLDADVKDELLAINGTPPDLFMPPKGCAFASRCEYAMQICKEEYPEEACLGGLHKVNCWLTHPQAPVVKSPINGKEVRA